MTNLFFVSGSQRRESLNARLLINLAQRLEGRCHINMLEPAQVDLPLFNQDLEGTPWVLDRVVDLHHQFKASDGIVVASPEYNGQLTPYLTNLVAWVSRLAYIDRRFDHPFHNHPLLLCSASTGGSGGAIGLSHARSLFSYVGCQVAEDSICVPYADQAWTDNGFEFDAFFDEEIMGVTDRFLEMAQTFAGIERTQLETV